MLSSKKLTTTQPSKNLEANSKLGLHRRNKKAFSLPEPGARRAAYSIYRASNLIQGSSGLPGLSGLCGFEAAGGGEVLCAEADADFFEEGGGRLAAGEDPNIIVGKRSEEHTSELQSPIDISYAVFCLKK